MLFQFVFSAVTQALVQKTLQSQSIFQSNPVKILLMCTSQRPRGVQSTVHIFRGQNFSSFTSLYFCMLLTVILLWVKTEKHKKQSASCNEPNLEQTVQLQAKVSQNRHNSQAQGTRAWQKAVSGLPRELSGIHHQERQNAVALDMAKQGMDLPFSLF